MDCAVKFEKDVAAIPGVTRAELNFGASKITVEGSFDPKTVSQTGSRHDIETHTEGEKPAETKGLLVKNKRALISSLSGLTLLMGWLLQQADGSKPIIIFLFMGAIGIGGYATVRKAFFSLRKLSFDMNVLMTVAVIGAVAIGEWSEGASVAFLFSISNTLESFTMDKARQSIKNLMDIAPREALIRRSGKESLLPVSDIALNDILIVRPGEKLAMDGIIIKGYSTVNQAAITGESIPVEKGVADEVFAGTLNQEGALEVQVTKLVHDTTIAKIIHMVEEAQAQKAPLQQYVDRFAEVYTPIVIILAAGIVSIPPIFFGMPWPPWIYRGLALLVVSCPCALVVSTPVALVSAIANAAHNGVLIKGGAHLEQMGSLSVVAFDKTGTLTSGKPVVTDIISHGLQDEIEVLKFAASIEQLSQHPLAKAIVEKAKNEEITLLTAENFTSFTGKGAKADFNGQTYLVGNPKLFKEFDISLEDLETKLSVLQQQGKTAMLLGTRDKILGIVAVADTVRDTSMQIVQHLKQSGIKHTIMLTGDNHFTAQAIAIRTGVDEFEAELLPENKVNTIKNLLDKYPKVAMVGDGINDAPALATATVGIAMGGAGTDSALETADIVLMADDLSKLPFLVKLSRAAMGIIKQNIYFALTIKLCAVLLVFPGWLTLWMAILADMGASVLVTLNGIRLLKMKTNQ